MVFRVDRTYRQIGDKADDEQSGHQQHGGVVGIAFWYAGINVRGRDEIHEAGAENRRDGPGCDQTPMNSTDLVSSKQISQLCRNRGKSATVHRDDDCGHNDEKYFTLDDLSPRHGTIQERPEK